MMSARVDTLFGCRVSDVADGQIDRQLFSFIYIDM